MQRPDTFRSRIAHGDVLVDFWGPRCQPCIALMPAVEALETRYGGRLRLVNVSAPENRAICRKLRVLGLPTYVLYRHRRRG
jgi:thioredoxin 1